MKRRNAVRQKPFGFEQLEPRRVLATYLVDSVGDDASGATDGLLSLREAIIASSTNAPFGDAGVGDATGDTIRFSPSLASQTITLTNGQLNITDDLKILGGTLDITIDANSSSRIFNIATGEIVNIGRLTLVNGQSVQGGAISASGAGTTILSEVNFSNNDASGIGGGAIYNVDQTMYIASSNFFSNTATGATGSGGAVLTVAGKMAFSSCTFESNVANRAGGAIETIDGTLYMSNSIIGGAGLAGNIAGPTGTASPGNGGGIHVTGSAGAGVFLDSTDVLGNYAAREGGGLWNQGGATMSVRNDSLIANNTAAGIAADDGGGGVFNNGGNFKLIDSVVSNNVAIGTAGSGGGIFSTAGLVYLNNATVSSNIANRAGGGIELIDGLTYIRNSTIGGDGVIDGNVAGPAGTAAPGNGGGLHVTGNAARVVVEGSIIQGNDAAREGGGLWNQAGSSMVVRGMTVISDNIASGNAADDGGGGIFNNGGNVVLNNVTLAGNTADGVEASGGGLFSIGGYNNVVSSTISSNVAAKAGGGVAVTGGGIVRLTDSVVGGSLTSDGNIAGNLFAATPGCGGGIYLSDNGSVVVARNTTIDNNTATTSGGGIHIGLGGVARTDTNSTVSFNSTTLTGSQGGGVYSAGYLRVLDSVFEGNVSLFAGGGLYNSSTGIAVIDSSDFLSNNGGTRGGGIFNDNYVSLDDSFVMFNLVSDTGGGIFTSVGESTVLNNTTVIGNLPNNTN